MENWKSKHTNLICFSWDKIEIGRLIRLRRLFLQSKWKDFNTYFHRIFRKVLYLFFWVKNWWQDVLSKSNWLEFYFCSNSYLLGEQGIGISMMGNYQDTCLKKKDKENTPDCVRTKWVVLRAHSRERTLCTWRFPGSLGPWRREDLSRRGCFIQGSELSKLVAAGICKTFSSNND